MQIGAVVKFQYAGEHTAHAVIDGVKQHKGVTYVHVQPVAWLVGNPLPQWKTAMQVREIAPAIEKAS